MEVAGRPRLLLVGRPGNTLNLVQPALAASGVDVVVEAPERAIAAAEALAPKGVIIVLDRPEDSSVAGSLAAAAVAPVLALEAPQKGSETAALVRTADAFARQLTKKKDAKAGVFAGLRFLLITQAWDKAEGLVRDLRAAGATVATADPSGKDWGAVRTIEPHVVLVDIDRPKEAELIERLRADTILRWAVHLPFEWDALAMEELSRIVEGWLASERELVKAAQKGNASASLDAIGVGRAVRALGDAGKPLRIHLTGGDGGGHIDVANGMIVGATFKKTGPESQSIEGTIALAVALAMEDAALRVEPCDRSMPANVAIGVAEALKAARLAQGSIGQETPTDPNVGWENVEFDEGTVPSLRMMVGQIVELIDDDEGDTMQVAPSAPPPLPARRTEPDPIPVLPDPEPDPELSVEAVPAHEQIVSLPDTPSPSPILSTAIPVPVMSVPALTQPAPRTPLPPPPAPQKKGGMGLILGIAGGVIAIGALGAAAFGLWILTTSDHSTPTAGSAPRETVVPPDPEPAVVAPPEEPVAREEPAAEEQPVAQAAVDAGPPSAEAWVDPLVEARARLRPGMTPNDLNRLATPVADVAGARIQSDLVLERAEALVRQREWASAEQQFQEAYLIYPRNPHVSASLAELYLERDRAPLAVQWARSALNLRRGRAEYAALLERAEAAAGGGGP